MGKLIEEIKVISKSKANKLGKEIRALINNDQELTEEQIDLLQRYRVSFKEDLSLVISIISQIAQIGGSDSIAAYRIKRIESIISKIKREPTMQLGNMGDIAGCRIILYRKDHLQDVITEIGRRFKVLGKPNNYIENPKEDGYNGYHVYIESPINSNRKLEIQIRTKETHKWSSLVEIIDNVYNLKLKEGQKHKDLQKFLLYLSDKKKLDIAQKQEIIDIDKKHNVYTKLFEVFLKNYSRIRHEWLNVKSFEDKRYFVFEVKTDNTSFIYSYKDYDEAEGKYFDLFKNDNKSNFVLAHIEKPKFKRICLAYASYVMIQHEYLDDWNEIIQDILRSSDSGAGRQIKNLLEYSKRNLNDQAILLEQELEDLKKYEADNDSNINVKSLNEWKLEIQEKIEKLPRNFIKGDKRKKNEAKGVIGWFIDKIRINL